MQRDGCRNTVVRIDVLSGCVPGCQCRKPFIKSPGQAIDQFGWQVVAADQQVVDGNGLNIGGLPLVGAGLNNRALEERMPRADAA